MGNPNHFKASSWLSGSGKRPKWKKSKSQKKRKLMHQLSPSPQMHPHLHQLLPQPKFAEFILLISEKYYLTSCIKYRYAENFLIVCKGTYISLANTLTEIF